MTASLQRIDHVNIVVRDLERVKQFFVALGFEVRDQAELKGEWISKIVELNNVEAEYVKLAPPAGGTMLELIRYDNPPANEVPLVGDANTLGFRHMACEVGNMEEAIAALKELDIQPLSEVQEYAPAKKKLVYFRGPEGILLELAEYGS